MPLSASMQHLIVICTIIELLVAIPAGMILKRIGFSAWWALLCFVPAVTLFSLWLLAFIRWPRESAQPQP